MNRQTVFSDRFQVRRLALVLPVFLLSACSIFEDGDCVALDAYGIHMTVEDSISGGAITSIPSFTAVDGDYTESLPQPNGIGGITFVAAFERPGTYDVTVRAAGYQDWIRNDVLVGRQPGKCGYLTTAQLRARMVN